LLHLPLHQWDALLAVIVATLVSIAVSEGGRWRLGLAAPPAIAARELLLGAGFAVLLIAGCDLLIIATTDLRHVPGGGFPWRELIVVYLPAAFHEEILFRGYPYQKVRVVSRPAAIAFTALVFALLHGGNAGVSPLAMVNLLLAGVLLALAYEVFGRLWFPIGIHAAWNILSGPILGYNVSGYVSRTTVMETRGGGAEWLTGGHFGIEASVWMVVVEGVAIVVLNIITSRRRYAAGKESTS
jgi:membrane protease YdiL (CAAX protease family)